MERKIGEVFEFEGKKLKVEKAKNGSCDGCAFQAKSCYYMNLPEEVFGYSYCLQDLREDGKSVIFKEVTDEESE